MEICLDNMTTEARNGASYNLDIMTPLEIITLMNQEDMKVPLAIKPHLEQIAKVIDWCIASVERGGRIVYMGAGTSGRLGVVDASECPPTFGVSPSMVVGLMAGGEKAFVKAVEGAEDSPTLGRDDLVAIGLTECDTVIGLAASGRTPYVVGGLEYAKEKGCHTASISCNTGSDVGKAAELAIEITVGPEVLTGSTRLKAGTAQKLVLNMISTATMVSTGKCYENLMVDVIQANEKLHVRAQNIVMEATGVSRPEARDVLAKAGGSAKKAIVMILAGCAALEADERLARAHGHVRAALGKEGEACGILCGN